jgi:hypothetical protein
MRILAAILLFAFTGCAPMKKVKRPPATKQEKRIFVLAVIYAGGLITLGEILSRRN